MWGGLHPGAGAVAFLLQVVVHEAPAWAVSMVIHMVTLVTMTMVAVPDPVPYKATQLTVTPRQEEKVEEIKEAEQRPTHHAGRTHGARCRSLRIEGRTGQGQ